VAVPAESDDETRLEQALRRRLERMREPQVFHPITAKHDVRTAYPQVEKREDLHKSDVERRMERRTGFDRDLHKRLARKLREGAGESTAIPADRLSVMKKRLRNLRPAARAGRPTGSEESRDDKALKGRPIVLGDSLAARARRLRKKTAEQPSDEDERLGH
jgi:hypothetical protein